jgi:hypothetical protein
MTFVDPPAPPEPGEATLRAKDLKNKVCLFRAQSLGEWPATEDKKAQPYVTCDVWVLDRAGIIEQSADVRISWWRAVGQLSPHLGEIMLGMPVEQDDRSVILVSTSKQEWRDLAARCIKEIEGADTRSAEPGPTDEDSEPF